MKRVSILFISIALFLACNSSVSTKKPGICLSFDDRSVDEWFELRDLFNDFGVKATFFITQPDSLNLEEIRKLEVLQEDGHEIGFHGTNHVFAEDYIRTYSYASYLNSEIEAGLAVMDSLGFNCQSFAYPYGSKYWFTDVLLLNYFQSLRTVAFWSKGSELSSVNDIYYSFDNDHTLSAIGIDDESGIKESHIDEAIQRALLRTEVLMIYGHTPSVEKDLAPYRVNTELLRHIFSKAKDQQLIFYTFNELNEE